MTRRLDVEVAIVGGGPAGAALAIELADAGVDVAMFERLGRPRWRAAGVYASPLTRPRLRRLGLGEGELRRLIRPIDAMVLRTADGSASARLEYPAPHACGLDRVELEAALLDRARAVGATVCEGAPVRAVRLAPGRRQRPALDVSTAGARLLCSAELIVGADGPASMVARAAGVAVPSRRFRRAGVTGHRADPGARSAGEAMAAEMVVGRGWYLGVAPVPRGRVNLGLVVGEERLRREARRPDGPAGLLEWAARRVPGSRRSWAGARATDNVAVALPLAHRVRRSAGERFLLVGDAAGFLDPLSGEGLQRALAGAHRAAGAILAWSRGDRTALSDYDRHLRARYRSKDALSWLLQGFLATPALTAVCLRSLDRQPDLARTLADALADMAAATRAMDPRFLGRLMAG